MTTLLEFDNYLFEIINQDLQNPFLDWIMPFWRDKKSWIPLYLGLFIFSMVKFKWKAVFFALGIAATVGVADTVSSKFIKKSVQRIRPCNDELVKEDVHLLVGCGGGYSFTSSHATNHFAIAAFISLTLGLLYPWTRLPFYLWAGSIAFGQVYVGVHYPLDVASGAIIGTIIGYIVAKIYNRFDQLRLS